MTRETEIQTPASLAETPFLFDFLEEYPGATCATTTGTHNDIDGSDSL